MPKPLTLIEPVGFISNPTAQDIGRMSACVEDTRTQLTNAEAVVEHLRRELGRRERRLETMTYRHHHPYREQR